MSKHITMKDAVGKYLEHLEAISKSASTRGTVERDLSMAVAYLGEEKELGKILAVHIAGFFKSESVNKIGDPPRDRRPATVLQIKRITRQFLVWGHERGYSDKAPIPQSELPRRKAKDGDQPKAEAKKAKTNKPKKKGSSAVRNAAPDAPTPPTGDAPAEAEATPAAE